MMNAPPPEGLSALRPKQLHRCIASAATIFLFAGIAASAAAPTRGAAAGAPSATIVFASNRSGNSQIYSVHADGSRLGQLTRNHASDTAPRFSPDGRRIVFARSTNCCGPGLWVMKADGSRQRRLAAYGSYPAWSPDSRRIAYVGLGKGAGNSEPLVIAGIDNRRRSVVRGTTSNPVWSPDGRWIAFARGIGDRYDLMVVGRDGGRPRTLRRNGGGPLGWTRRGEVMINTSRGIDLVRPDGRTVRRLPAVRGYAAALSPDGRRLAWVAANGRHLRIRALAGGRIRDITPRGTEYLESPTWSPNGRWIAVASLPAGGVYDDLLVVAANGTSSRRVTQRVPYPYGRENQQPNWRPRGATRARLGRRPVAPLPSETVSRSAFGAPGGGTINSLAADGDRVAMVIDFPYCASVEVWDTKRGRVSRLKQPCGPHNEGGGSSQEGTYGVALAGTRAAWIHAAGGNTLETYVDTATLARRRPVSLASGAADNGGAGTFAGAAFGDGALLAFTLDKRCDSYGDVNGRPEDQCPPGKRTGDVVAASVWRVGGQGRCPWETPPSGGCTRVAEAVGGDLTVLAVEAGRIATRTDTGVRLLTEQGAVLRDFAVKARAAALSGTRLAVRTATAIEIYDTESGDLSSRIPVAGDVTLDDLEGDLLVTAAHDTVSVRRLGDGRTTTFRPGGTARAQLEQPGLFVAGTRRVTFTPMSELLRRLGA